MSRISKEKKEDIIELLSKQEKAKLSWVATVTQIPEAVIINNVQELGLYIDGEYLSIHPSKTEMTKQFQVEASADTQIPQKDDSLKRVFRPGLLGAMNCGFVRFYWAMNFSFFSIVGIAFLFICLPLLFIYLVELAIAFAIFIPFFLLGLFISLPYKFTFHPEYIEHRTWLGTKKILYRDIQHINFKKRQVYVRVSRHRRELRDRHIILYITTNTGNIKMNLFMYDYADGSSIKNRLIIRTAEINKNVTARQFIH